MIKFCWHDWEQYWDSNGIHTRVCLKCEKKQIMDCGVFSDWLNMKHYQKVLQINQKVFRGIDDRKNKLNKILNK